jgi:hypothetical protein
MKKTAFAFRFVLGLMVGSASLAHANVKITSPVGGNNVPADKAMNSTNGAAFTVLGNIVIAEGAAGDFAAGNNQTLILTAPIGWQFKTGTGTATLATRGDLSAASILVTPSTATITFSAAGTANLDTLTIGSLQIQAINGASAPADYIRCLYGNSGTAVIAGIDVDYTTFGLLNQAAGGARALTLAAQPGSTGTAGMNFSPQPSVNVVDQFGNLRNLDNTTVVTVSAVAGSGTLQGTLARTAVFGVATYTNLAPASVGTFTLQFAASNCTSVTSSPITVVGPSADHLVFSTQPSAATAGAPFGVQPVIKTADFRGNFTTQGLANHQYVTLALSGPNGTLLGTTTLDIGTSAGNGTVSFSDLEIDAAGTNYQLVATSPNFTGSRSSVFQVGPGGFVTLQLLLPGETAAPATLTGKTGTPLQQVAGTPFNVTVNAVDVFYNVAKTATDTIGISSSDSNTTLPANAALLNGTKTMSVTFKTAGSATLTAGDISNAAKSSNASSPITVNAGVFSKLQILAPGETAAPGTVSGKVGSSAAQTAASSFSVIVNAVDANWNPVANVSHVVGLTSSDANAVLPANTALAGGTITLDVTPLTAGSSTFTAKDITDTSKSSSTSSAIAVAAGPFAQLQVLLPGETAAPGTATGKTGSPIQAMTGQPFSVAVNAVDANWNKVKAATDVISLASSDTAAVLPADAALAAGALTASVTLNTVGSATVTATDSSDNRKASVTSATLTVALPLYTAATGGSAISADTTGGTYTTLVGPVYTEVGAGNVGAGTIILKAPAGFVFNTVSPLPTVLINGNGGKTYNLNGISNGAAAALTSVTSTQLVFTVTKPSSGGFPCKLTWQNVKVRPTAGTPLASGNLRFTGTASMVSVSTNSNLGLLQEVPGAANKFALQTQPSATATAGVPFAQQPVLQILDKFGNFRTNDSATVVTATRSAGTGTLQGTTARTAASGIVTFTDLAHNVATNITILFSAPGVTNATSSSIAVTANVATTLAFAVQPGNATAGSIFGTQPVVTTQDSYGNNSTVGLAKSLNIDLSLNPGTGPLQGTLTADIGTTTGNGRVAFTDLRIDAAGAGQQLKVTANGFVTGNSSVFTVNAGAATQLLIGTQPSSSAQAGVIFPQQPAIFVLDIFGNLRTSDNTTVVTVARSAGTDVLLGTKTATAKGGIATFTNLSYTNMETISLSFSNGTLPVLLSSPINVGPGAARKLRIIAQPSTTAAAGQAFAQQPQIRLEDQYGNICTNDNATLVTASRNTGTATLQGTTSITASAGFATFTDLNYPKAETMSIVFKGGAATNAISTNVVVKAGVFTKLLLLAPGETAAPGTAAGKTGIVTNQAPDTAFNVTVRATDDNWNFVTNATDVITFSSSDVVASMPTNAALVAGTKVFSVKMSESGTTNTVTASDLTDGTKVSSTVALGVTSRYISATGGEMIPASTAGATYTSLIGPIYSEKLSAEVGIGTIILNAPAGFVFDTNGPAPTVKIEAITLGTKSPANINGVTNGTSAAMTSVSSTQLVFTVTKASYGNKCKLTWQNIRVMPKASTPLALGRILKTGTSVMAGVTNSISNFGTLLEIPDGTTFSSAMLANYAIASDTTSDSSDTASTSATDGGSADVSSIVVGTPVTVTGISSVDGAMVISFAGAPNQTYQIERAQDLQSGWSNIGSATTDSAGQGQFTDSNAPANHGFYRTATAAP